MTDNTSSVDHCRNGPDRLCRRPTSSVPIRGALLGVPSVAGLSVQVLDASYETLSGMHLPPAPGSSLLNERLDKSLAGVSRQIFVINSTRYATDAFYPGPLAEIGGSGMMCDQAVVQVQFYPIQYNLVTSEVHFYRRLRVKSQ